MKKRMFISAARPNEVRAAIVDSRGKLEAYELEVADAGLTRGNIYIGTVANTEASLNAAFIEYGAPKQGFLPIGDVCPQAYHQQPKSGEGRPKITEVLRRRRKILVQVVKDAVGNKGAALTTEIALAGRYAVFTPFDASTGISRKIEDETERRRLKEIIAQADLPDGAGVIARTSAEGHSDEEIATDLARLVEEWQTIFKRSKDRRTKSGTCLYADNDLVVRMLRDQFRSDCEAIVIDTEEAYETAVAYFKRTMPEHVNVLKRWDKPGRLFSSVGLESQIAQIYERRVGLPSGGYLIIEPTEALTVVDVNSGRSTSQSSQAETAYATNLESADELARQLRLRDIGGLVVVDFIDMSSRRHNRNVEKRLKEALKSDRARTYVGDISENGLLEINRQRIKQALHLQTHQACPTCGGSGLVRGTRFAAVNILRRIEERAANGRLREVHIDLHPDLAHQLQNTFRAQLHEIEGRYDITINVFGRPALQLSEEQVVWNERPPTESDERDAQAHPPERSQETDQSTPTQTDQKADSSAGKSERNSKGARQSDDQRQSGGSSRRRRRRRRSRRRTSPDKSQAQAQNDQAGQSPQPSQDQKSSGGGAQADSKGARQKNQAAAADESSGDPSQKAEQGGDASGGNQSTASGEQQPKSRRRRRRRRRRGGSGRKTQKDGAQSDGQKPDTTTPGHPNSADPSGAASNDPTASPSKGGESQTPPPKSRRRRRRRRGRSSGENTGEATGDAGQPPS